ncbi:MAG: prepilin-type N-terminal cleavage/methylation domain-containing protein [Sulfurospirillaceae bacterium]|nr:prepilin-type N-terminal cleavage/methylation domain-containing protein [Sulfurospirillaceae bacterium]
MRSSKAGFTLIELMISITILTVMMTYLYESYGTLNSSNRILKNEVQRVVNTQKMRKVIFLDFSLALPSSIEIQNREKNEDVVFLQSSNSIHRRFNPYITYIVKDKKLYRLESLRKFTSYELSTTDRDFDIDYLGIVNSFRVYKSSNSKKNIYLIHIDFKNSDDILLKVNVLNEI